MTPPSERRSGKDRRRRDVGYVGRSDGEPGHLRAIETTEWGIRRYRDRRCAPPDEDAREREGDADFAIRILVNLLIMGYANEALKVGQAYIRADNARAALSTPRDNNPVQEVYELARRAIIDAIDAAPADEMLSNAELDHRATLLTDDIAGLLFAPREPREQEVPGITVAGLNALDAMGYEITKKRAPREPEGTRDLVRRLEIRATHEGADQLGDLLREAASALRSVHPVGGGTNDE